MLTNCVGYNATISFPPTRNCRVGGRAQRKKRLRKKRTKAGKTYKFKVASVSFVTNGPWTKGSIQNCATTFTFRGKGGS